MEKTEAPTPAAAADAVLAAEVAASVAVSVTVLGFDSDPAGLVASFVSSSASFGSEEATWSADGVGLASSDMVSRIKVEWLMAGGDTGKTKLYSSAGPFLDFDVSPRRRLANGRHGGTCYVTGTAVKSWNNRQRTSMLASKRSRVAQNWLAQQPQRPPDIQTKER